MSGVDAFVCPRCGAVSHNPTDIAEGYCAKCHDWTQDPEWKAYTTHVRTELVPKIAGSTIGISIVPVNPEDVDVKFAIELGLMIMYDKPILLLVDPTTILPERLRRVADEIVVYDQDHPDPEAVLKAMRRMGVDK